MQVYRTYSKFDSYNISALCAMSLFSFLLVSSLSLGIYISFVRISSSDSTH